MALNVIRSGQTPSAEDQAQCIRRLNQMMALWEADGRALGYVPVGTVTTTLTVPDGSILGIWTSLAINVAPLFGANVSPELIALNERGMSVIDKLCAQQVLMELDVPAESHSGGYSIETD